MKKSFTMLELIIVIIVISILAVIIIPKITSNKLAEAATQVLSDIRYTQHLAMVDDVYDRNDNVWFKKRWQIAFSTSDANADNKPAYLIFKDKNADGTINKSEIAINPQNKKKYLSGGLITNATMDIRDLSTFDGTRALNIGLKYGITDIVLSSSCSTGTKISFDNLGRPIKGPFNTYTTAYPNNKLISSACTIRLDSDEGNMTIVIEPETGYAHML